MPGMLLHFPDQSSSVIVASFLTEYQYIHNRLLAYRNGCTVRGVRTNFSGQKMRHQGKQLSGPVKLGLLFITLGSVAAIVVLCRLPELPLISLPELKGLRFEGGMAINPELSAAIIAISLFGGAFVAEVVRAGLGSIPAVRSKLPPR